MYSFLKAMKWSHLPVAGGVYDQHPRFVDEMFELMQLDNEQQAKEHREQEMRAKRKK